MTTEQNEIKSAEWRKKNLSKNSILANVSGSLLSFEQCLREEFLVNTQNYPKEYHNLFHQKFERAEKRFREQSGNDR